MINTETMTQLIESWEIVKKCRWKRFLLNEFYKGACVPFEQYCNDFETLTDERFYKKYSPMYYIDKKANFKDFIGICHRFKKEYEEAYSFCKNICPDFEVVMENTAHFILMK